MKRFLSRILLLSAIVALVVVAPIVYKRHISPVSFSIDKSKNILILGDSHTECAIDDSIFSRAANFSRSAETYLYSYVKLKNFIAANDQIKTVILAFSYYSLSDLQEYWYYRSDAVEDKIPRFLFFMNLSEVGEIARLNPAAFYRAAFGATTRSLLTATDLHEMHIGGHLHLNRHELAQDLAQIKVTPHKQFMVSHLQTKYLQKIIDFCREKKLTLLFLNVPMYKGGSIFYMKDYFYNIYSRNYTDIPLLDYANYPMPDSCYGDANHLNYDGANNFSTFLRDRFNGKHPSDTTSLNRNQ